MASLRSEEAAAKSVAPPPSEVAQSSAAEQDIPMGNTANDETSSTLGQSWAVLSDPVDTAEVKDNKTTGAIGHGQAITVPTFEYDITQTSSASDRPPKPCSEQRCNDPTCTSWGHVQKDRLNEISQTIQEELNRAGPLHPANRNRLIDEMVKRVPLAVDRYMLWGKLFEESLPTDHEVHHIGTIVNKQKVQEQHYDMKKSKMIIPIRDTHATRRESILKQKHSERRKSTTRENSTNVLNHGNDSKASSSRTDFHIPLQSQERSSGQEYTTRIFNERNQAHANTMPPHTIRMDFAVPDGWELRVSIITGYPFWIHASGIATGPPAGLKYHRQRCQIDLPYGWEMYRLRKDGHAEAPVFVNHESMVTQFQWPGLVRPLESMLQGNDRTLPPVILLCEEGAGVRRAH